MSTRLLFIVLAIAMAGGCASAEETNTTCNLCGTVADSSERVDCLTRLVEATPVDGELVGRAVRCSISIWRIRDGALGFEVSDALLSMMQANPAAFFLEMTHHEKEFAEWLISLPELSFTWYRDPPSPLEAKRLQLIHRLQETTGLAPNARHLRDRVVAKLQGIQPRQVD